MRKRNDRVFRCNDPKDYEIFSLAVPHHDEFQAKIAQTVAQNVAKAGAEKGYDLCEIGPGTGVTLSFLLKHTNNLRYIDRLDAVDNSSEMIQILRSNIADPRIHIIEADILDFLKSRISGYDGIYSAYTIHNLEQDVQKKIFRRIHSNLRSGGFFVDGDIFAYADKDVQDEVFEWQIKMYGEHVPSPHKEEWIEHIREDQKNYFILEQAVSLLKEIGFAVEVMFREKLEAVLLARKPWKQNPKPETGHWKHKAQDICLSARPKTKTQNQLNF